MLENNYQIRPARPDDSDGVRRVQVATWRATYRGMLPEDVLDELTSDRRPTSLQKTDQKVVESRRAFVAVDSANEIVGFSVGGLARDKPQGFESEVWAIYVLKEHQGASVGRKLFEALRDDLAENFKSMIVWSLRANTETHKFYERMGGRRLELTKQFHWNGKDVAEEVAHGWDKIS